MSSCFICSGLVSVLGVYIVRHHAFKETFRLKREAFFFFPGNGKKVLIKRYLRVK